MKGRKGKGTEGTRKALGSCGRDVQYEEFGGKGHTGEESGKDRPRNVGSVEDREGE